MSEKHCWADQAEFVAATEGGDSLAWLEAWRRNGTCLLPRGHDGPHEWTPDGEIVAEFVPKER